MLFRKLEARESLSLSMNSVIRGGWAACSPSGMSPPPILHSWPEATLWLQEVGCAPCRQQWEGKAGLKGSRRDRGAKGSDKAGDPRRVLGSGAAFLRGAIFFGVFLKKAQQFWGCPEIWQAYISPFFLLPALLQSAQAPVHPTTWNFILELQVAHICIRCLNCLEPNKMFPMLFSFL